MSEISEIFRQFGENIVPEIKSVSKRFAPSVESTYVENGNGAVFTITASEFITTLIDGRRPTSPNAPKGNPTLQQILLEWIKHKGIAPRQGKDGRTPTLEQLSWAMATSMHKKGDLLWQRGGGNDIFEPIITEKRITSLFSLLSNSYLKTIESSVIKNLNNVSNSNQ